MTSKSIYRTCKKCNSSFETTSSFVLYCDNCRPSKIRERDIELNGVVCQICGEKALNLINHLKKKHGLTRKEYELQFPGFKVISEVVTKKLSDGIKGEKNPAFNHGGKFSPFSKKFIKYQDLSTEETNALINTTKEKAVENRTDESCNTKIEYYLAKGMNEKEAKEALCERQSTFSLKKCIETHGKEEGTKIWQERQNKWQDVLNSKSPEEIKIINKKKATKITFNSLKSQNIDCEGYFYILKLNNELFKIGITSKDTIKRRYGSDKLDNVEVLCFEKTETINHAYRIEQVLKTKYKDTIKKDDYGPFAWTEVIRAEESVLLLEVNHYLNNPELVLSEYKTYF